ncbi:MAG: hypothetical protein ACTSRS_10335 [Candidatus Helarchaeota archaeon]
MEKKDLVGHYRFLMWGGGLILIVVGLGLKLLISFLIGEPLTLLYPYVNETVLLIMEIAAWVNIIPGSLLFILGFFAVKLARYETEIQQKKEKGSKFWLKILRIIVIITSILLILAFPIGTFVGLILLRESWMLKETELNESEEKNS